MNINKIIEIEHDTCRSRSEIRNTKDLFRISTSNLNKKELEDVYYSLLDNNLELKKTINSQKDQIKMLTTRISRLTQKNIYSTQKGSSKNTLNENKEIILDLKQANEKLVERVRLLNMQLCSAKQFVKHQPLQTTRCQNCANIKNSSSITLLNTKRSQLNLRTKSTASQYVEHDVAPIVIEETVRESTSHNDQECTQNKCKTSAEELQIKIEDLQEQLSKVNEQYAIERKKIIDFDKELFALKEENLRIRSQGQISAERLQQQKKNYQEVLKKLRTVEAQNETFSLELVLEKQRTRELETQLRAADISHTIAQALSQAVKINESVPIKIDESSPMKEDVSLPMNFNESLPMKDDESLPMKDDKSLSMNFDESLSSAKVNKSSLIPVRVNESFTSVKHNDSPNKVEQSDDSGYLEATKFFEYGGGDITLEMISEQQERNTNTVNDKKRKKRKSKSKRDSSVESFEENSGMSSKDLLKTHVDKVLNDATNIIEDQQSRTNIDVNLRTMKDAGTQCIDKKYVTRAVGDVLEDYRVDTEVQIGDSLCAMPVIDTKTYSRKSNHTYSVKGPAADNTECDVSSLSDLPSERNVTPSDYISPGEAVSTDYSSSYSELSEGELLVSHQLSNGEVEANTSVGEQKRSISPSVRIDRAMKVAKEEADRLARLLEGRPVDLPGVTVNPVLLFRPRYQKTQ